MEIAKGIAILSIPLGMIYLFMGFFASQFAKDKVLAVSPWWAFYPDNFEGSGKGLCSAGKKLGLLAMALCLPYFALFVAGI